MSVFMWHEIDMDMDINTDIVTYNCIGNGHGYYDSRGPIVLRLQHTYSILTATLVYQFSTVPSPVLSLFCLAHK
jgi:hypothetical protein